MSSTGGVAAGAWRLPTGGCIDRARPVAFRFNGRDYTGFEGDTLASALLAHGQHFVARSWKYHRPRGIVALGSAEPNALVQLGRGDRTVPNARATEVEIHDGLEAWSVNCWPSLHVDVLALNGLAARLIPAGFYYKTFMWPRSWWERYEHWIRKAAGLGVAPLAPDPDRYVRQNLHCDVLIAGAGPAGLAAALEAGRAGARVVLADEQPEPGGALLQAREQVDDRAARDWVRATVAELRRLPEVRLLRRTTVFGYHDHNFLTLVERLTDHLPVDSRLGPRERLWRVRARQVVLATGAIERPLVFGNNDRPGILLASAVSGYVNRYAVHPGRRAVVFTNNDSAYTTALDLRAAGVAIAAVVDARAAVRSPAIEAVRAAGIEVLAGSVVVRAHGGRRVTAVTVAGLDAEGRALAGAARRIDCDLVAMSGGWSPTVHLQAQSGAPPRWDEARVCFVPGAARQAQVAAGACNGSFALADCLSEGVAAGRRAALGAGFEPAPVRPPHRVAADESAPTLALWSVPTQASAGHGAKQFVDLQNDVTAADVLLAAREGYQSVEHLKRYTALGFGTDQGKLGNVNGLALLACALGRSIADTGTTTFRPNYTPVSFGAIAGRDVGPLFEPVRQTPLHDAHIALGAAFENVGQWKRPWYYPKAGEDLEAAVRRECLAARRGVALMDASTLGKIELRGPDVAEFLNRVYTNNWHTLKVGHCRYGLMLREDGMVLDDGVTARLGEQHYFMTTTTGGAARVYAWLERWLQTEWPRLRVYLTSVTDHVATIAVVGPRSRQTLQRIAESIDLDAAAFPFMTWRDGRIAGIPARFARISFSGELAFEVSVEGHRARELWDALLVCGREFDVTPYGTETMHVLRAEKGYIIVGQDTDGAQTPEDLGMDWILSKTKDYIGRRSLARPDTRRADRRHLVGLLSADPARVLPEGGQLTRDPAARAGGITDGHVTSSYFSAALGRSFALGLLGSGRARHGETVYVTLADGTTAPAVVGGTVFYDPEGGRLHG